VSVVVDANLIVALILPLPYSGTARGKMAEWKIAGETILAPVLWEYELVSALRRAIVYKLLKFEQIAEILHQVMLLNVQSAPPSENLHQRALDWADQLGQTRAYDAQYLALAEQTGSELWTGDKRLVNGAASLGVNWVRWVAEESVV
jgi:predicted nucleic acid-binding protein